MKCPICKKGNLEKKKVDYVFLGKNIGKLLSIEGEEFNYGPIIYYRADSAGGSIAEAKQAAVNLVPSDLEVSASVKVEYKLRSF